VHFHYRGIRVRDLSLGVGLRHAKLHGVEYSLGALKQALRGSWVGSPLFVIPPVAGRDSVARITALALFPRMNGSNTMVQRQATVDSGTIPTPVAQQLAPRACHIDIWSVCGQSQRAL
jgi:hypothetical protein